jgi:hypothetical protein
VPLATAVFRCENEIMPELNARTNNAVVLENLSDLVSFLTGYAVAPISFLKSSILFLL